MSIADSYVNGVRLYTEGNYTQAALVLSEAASCGDLGGRLSRLFLGRCYWRNAWEAWRQNFRAKATQHLASAGELCGDSVELGRYLCRYYHAPQAEFRMRKPTPETVDGMSSAGVGAIGMLMKAYDAINSRPASSQFQMLAGLALCRQERWDQAADHFRRAAQLDPSDAQPLRKLGLCLAVQGDLAGSARSLSAAISLAGGDLVISRELFSASAASGVEITRPYNAGKPDNASLDQLADVQLAESDFVDSFLALPHSAADGELFALTAAFMSRVLESFDNYADMQFKCAQVYNRFGDMAEAVAHARRAVELNPGYIQAHYMLGSLLMESDVRQAAAHLSKAVEAGGDYADIRADLGLACKRLGWTQRARDEFNRSLAINGDFSKAREELHKLGA